MKAGTPWLTAVHDPEATQVPPFETWNPCVRYDECRKSRKIVGGVGLECYDAIQHLDPGELRVSGCRFVEGRLAIRYFCLDDFCDRLREASATAWASLARVQRPAPAPAPT